MSSNPPIEYEVVVTQSQRVTDTFNRMAASARGYNQIIKQGQAFNRAAHDSAMTGLNRQKEALERASQLRKQGYAEQIRQVEQTRNREVQAVTQNTGKIVESFRQRAERAAELNRRMVAQSEGVYNHNVQLLRREEAAHRKATNDRAKALQDLQRRQGLLSDAEQRLAQTRVASGGQATAQIRLQERNVQSLIAQVDKLNDKYRQAGRAQATAQGRVQGQQINVRTAQANLDSTRQAANIEDASYQRRLQKYEAYLNRRRAATYDYYDGEIRRIRTTEQVDENITNERIQNIQRLRNAQREAFQEQQRQRAMSMEHARENIAAWNRAGQSMQQFGGVVRGAGYTMTATLTAPLVLVGKIGVQFNNMQTAARNALASLPQVVGDTTSELERMSIATGVLEELYEFATKTPFEFSNVTVSAQKLLASGIKLDQIKPILEGIGNAASLAAASGANAGDIVERLSFTFAKMAARGKVQQATLRSFVAAGIPVYEQLARAISETEGKQVSVQEVNERIRKGMITSNFAIKAITDALNKDFGGAMERLRQTVPGAMAEMEDRFRLFVGALTKPMHNLILPMIHRVSATLKILQDRFEQMSDTQRNLIVGALAMVAAIGPILIALGSLIGILGHLATGIASFKALVLGAFGPGGGLAAIGAFIKGVLLLNPIMLGIAATIGIVATLIYNNWQYIAAGWTHLVNHLSGYWEAAGGGLMRRLTAAWDTFKEYFFKLWNGITGIFQGAIDSTIVFFQENWPLIQLTIQTTIDNAVRIIQFFAGFLDSQGSVMWLPIQNGLNLLRTVITVTWNFILANLKAVMLLMQGDIGGAMEAIAYMAGQNLRVVYDFVATWFQNVEKMYVHYFKKLLRSYEILWEAIKTATTVGAAAAFAQIVSIASQESPKLELSFGNYGSRIGKAFWDGVNNQARPGAANFLASVQTALPDALKEVASKIPGAKKGLIGQSGELDLDDAVSQGGEKAAKRDAALDKISNALQKIKSDIESVRANFALMDENELAGIIKSLETIKAGADPTLYGDVVRGALAGVDLSVLTDTDNITEKFRRIGVQAEREIQKFAALEKVTESQVAAFTVDVWQKAAYQRLDILKEAQKDREKLESEVDLLKFEVLDARIAPGYTQVAKEFSAIEKEAAKFEARARKNPLFDPDKIETLVDNFREYKEELFEIKQKNIFETATDDLKRMRAELEPIIELRENKELAAKIAQYRRDRENEIKDATKVNQLVQEYSDIQTEISIRAREDREQGIRFERERLRISQIYDDATRKVAERQQEYIEIVAEKIKSGWGKEAAEKWAQDWKDAQDKLDFNTLRRKIEEAVRPRVTPITNQQRIGGEVEQFIQQRTKGTQEGLIKLQEDLERVRALFGYVATDIQGLKQQLAALDALDAGQGYFGGILNGLKSILRETFATQEGLTSLFTSFGQAMSGVLAGTESFGQAIKKFFFNLLGDLAIQFGTFLIAYGTGIAFVPGWNLKAGPAIAAGIALVALGGFLKALAGGSGGTNADAAAGTTSTGGGAIESRSRRPTRIPFNTSGETTVNVTFQAGDDAPLSKMFARHMEKNGFTSIRSGRNSQRGRLKRQRGR